MDIEDYPIKYKPSGISVTDFSAQLWCEEQLGLKLKLRKPEIETEALLAGRKRHEELELEDHKFEEIVVTTREDKYGAKVFLAIQLLNQLLETGRAREIPILGLYEDTVVRGIVDEFRVIRNAKGESETMLSDTKTRQSRKPPSSAQKRTTAMQLNV
eukprot:GHVL01036703.1.p1 GENE.GHVL01036703.1~~GHVL01036703.1.p1  ORF type:complete len:157 (-),score=30.89 GHVL01036703.1:159-629(-)